MRSQKSGSYDVHTLWKRVLVRDGKAGEGRRDRDRNDGETEGEGERVAREKRREIEKTRARARGGRRTTTSKQAPAGTHKLGDAPRTAVVGSLVPADRCHRPELHYVNRTRLH